jgi:hypothetical protein
MVNLHDLSALIDCAQTKELADPAGAHARYEVAERKLDEFLTFTLRTTRQYVMQNPDSCYGKRFGPFYQRIQDGYNRLIEQKDYMLQTTNF